jgi:hypothetical protein
MVTPVFATLIRWVDGLLKSIRRRCEEQSSRLNENRA